MVLVVTRKVTGDAGTVVYGVCEDDPGLLESMIKKGKKEYPNDTDLAPIATMLTDYMKDYEGVSAADQFTKEKIAKMLADIKTIRTKLAE